MKEAVLALKSQDNWASSLSKKYQVDVKVLDCKPANDGQALRQMVELETVNENENVIIEDIRSHPEVLDAYIVKSKRGKMIGTVLTRQAVVCSTVLNSNSFCRNCVFTLKPDENGKVRWSLALGSGSPLKEILGNIESHGIQADILEISQIPDNRPLTSRQEQIIRIALQKGYFNYPRKVGVRALAKEVGVSSSTLSELLRRAERKIVTKYLKAPSPLN